MWPRGSPWSEIQNKYKLQVFKKSSSRWFKIVFFVSKIKTPLYCLTLWSRKRAKTCQTFKWHIDQMNQLYLFYMLLLWVWFPSRNEGKTRKKNWKEPKYLINNVFLILGIYKLKRSYFIVVSILNSIYMLDKKSAY